MTAPKQRRIWQIHLSTAVLLLLMTGILLWINLSIYPHRASQDVNRIMTELKQGQFRKREPRAPINGIDVIEESYGWVEENEKKQLFHQMDLDYQAESVIEIGKDAVPALINWVTDDELQMRYIARYSLESITGIRNAECSYFESVANIKQKHLMDKTVDEWNAWYWRTRYGTTPIGFPYFLGIDALILLTLMVSCEWLIRRREARKT
jgi:hypothetical protein